MSTAREAHLDARRAAPAGGESDGLCRHDRAGAGRRGSGHDLRIQRRRHPADVRRDLPLQRGPPRAGDAARRAGNRAGRGIHGRGVRALERPRRRVRRHLGAGCDQLGDAGPRLPGRLRARGAHHRTGPARRDGHRRLPGSAGLQHHGGLREARLPPHRRDEGRGHVADGVRHRAPRTAGTGRGRHPARRAARAGRLPGRRSPLAARIHRAHRRPRAREHLARRRRGVLQAARRVGAAAALRRGRRHQRQRGGRAARLRGRASASPSSPRCSASGPSTPPASCRSRCSACTARPTPTTPSRTATS